MSLNISTRLTKVNYTPMTNKKNEYIVIHYTANRTDTAINNCKYFENVNRNASANWFVDGTGAVQCVKDTDRAGHCGVDYSHGTAPLWGKCTNNNSIGIEMCGTNGAVSEATFKNTVELTKILMAKYNIPAGNVVRHYDVCGKICPGWTGWGANNSNNSIWLRFKSEISSNKATNTQTTSHAHKVGERVTVSTHYKGPTDPNSSAMGCSPWINAIIDKIVEGKNPYHLQGYNTYCNDGDIRGNWTPSSSSNKSNGVPNVIYRVRNANTKKWYSEVTNYNDVNANGFAGSRNIPIDELQMHLSSGHIQYQVHTIGGSWLPWVTDLNDYAGISGRKIDGIKCRLVNMPGYHVKYSASLVGSDKYLGWVVDDSDYAGIYGRAIDTFKAFIYKD